MSRTKTKLLLVLLILGAMFVFSGSERKVNAENALSPDALGLRVYPNPDHYSPLRWYLQQGFSGSPEEKEIDGYQAISDGRTTYVNAANISGGVLYNNIYVMSYNQSSEKATVEIYKRMLERWKFNPNLSAAGRCSVSSFNCFEDKDCPESTICSANKCIYSEPSGCHVDSDCPSGFFCSNKKSQVIRDTKRLADLAEIKVILNAYRSKNRIYPTLTAGSYLSGKSLSVWPSWKQTLEKDVKGGTLPTDPINSLGSCGEDRFNLNTCWDNENKEFSGQNTENSPLELPDNSYVYSYAVISGGSDFIICASMESGYITKNCYRGLE